MTSSWYCIKWMISTETRKSFRTLWDIVGVMSPSTKNDVYNHNDPRWTLPHIKSREISLYVPKLVRLTTWKTFPCYGVIMTHAFFSPDWDRARNIWVKRTVLYQRLRKIIANERSQYSWQWRHNERDGVSNHQPHDYLLNRLFMRRSKKTSKLRVTGICEGLPRWPVKSPHKGPVTRKMFLFHHAVVSYLADCDHD